MRWIVSVPGKPDRECDSIEEILACCGEDPFDRWATTFVMNRKSGEGELCLRGDPVGKVRVSE